MSRLSIKQDTVVTDGVHQTVRTWVEIYVLDLQGEWQLAEISNEFGAAKISKEEKSILEERIRLEISIILEEGWVYIDGKKIYFEAIATHPLWNETKKKEVKKVGKRRTQKSSRKVPTS